MAMRMEDYQYLSVELELDNLGVMVARTGEPLKEGDPSFELGAVSGMSLALENGTLVVNSLMVAACPAGQCYRKVGGQWGCHPC